MITQQTLIATVAAGETTATADSEMINGEILKVAFDVTGNSMDINLDSLGEQKAQAIVDYTGNTDSTFYPMTPTVDNAGAENSLYAATFPVQTPFVVYGKLRLSLSSAAPAETVTMTVTYKI